MFTPVQPDRPEPECRYWLPAWLLLFFVLGLFAYPSVKATEVEKQEKLVLLIRELRNEAGEMVPIRDEIRQLLNYFEHQLHIKFEIRRYPWTRLLINAKAGEGIIFGLSKNRERLQTYQFSEAIYANYVWLVTRSDATFSYNSMLDLKGKTIGIVRGTSYGDEFDSQRNVLFQVEEDTSSHGARLKKLVNKRMDVMIFGDRRAQADEIEQLLLRILRKESSTADKTLEQGFKVLPKPMLVDELHFAAVGSQYQVWIRKLNAAILAGKKSGEISRILISDK
ncbi:ABC transporter substrate-binding protein [Undibacterium sp.]|uniref:substrate-binding periplasmic protein n=1 Tax=Undibacterium sp. TaxID=1914977 RepID=UPI00272F4A9E|nr:transporter substrate-binding domain-containing protein [Undibacterium sp.]MDP1978562.1 transporter substrate-binding domain-containing protein [Undibacterium sp.]